MKVIPYIKLELCVGCRICTEVCPADVFRMSVDKAVVMTPEKCIGCGMCSENCPAGAIELKAVE